MTLFYTNQIQGNLGYFEEQESLHITQVLRKREGDALNWVDGLGGLYEGKIVEVGKKKCVAQATVIRSNYGLRPHRLHIAIAPTKNMDRLEWFLEKATEIGIEEISLLHCKRSERTTVRTERLHGILISAMKQSGQAYLPQLHPLLDFKSFVKKQHDTTYTTFIAHCADDTQKLQLAHTYLQGTNALILIGPEGDFTPEEVQLALEQGFQAVALGNTRLRTETAGVAACHTIQLLNC